MKKLLLLFTLFTGALATPAWLQAQTTSQVFGGLSRAVGWDDPIV